jgi:hypothetical protein
MIAVLDEALRKEGTGVLSSISSAGNFFGRALSVSSVVTSEKFDQTPSAVELLMERRSDSQSPSSSLSPSESLALLPSRSSSA